jgi:hypothetical protein
MRTFTKDQLKEAYEQYIHFYQDGMYDTSSLLEDVEYDLPSLRSNQELLNPEEQHREEIAIIEWKLNFMKAVLEDFIECTFEGLNGTTTK